MSFSVSQLLKQASKQLEAVSDSNQLDAELLLAHALDKNRTWLHTWSDSELSAAQQQQFDTLLQRRLQGEPIAYILGEQAFWSLTLKVTPDTLIPRPETEQLVELALEKIPVDANWQILDLGTGSGAIALAIAHERPGCKVMAIDQSAQALQVARHNAEQHHISNVQFIQSHWFTALGEQGFQLIVANPPYVCENDPHLSQGDVRFEPLAALAGGTDGLDDLRIIVDQARQFLEPGGWLILEHGYDQAEAVQKLLIKHGYQQVQSLRDLAGQPRNTLAQL